jgi:hypothetical protein
MRYVPLLLTLALLALFGCAHTASTTMPDGSTCERTVFTALFWQNVTAQCHDANGQVIGQTPAN